MPHVYILLCCDGSYYVGQTVALERRVAQHQTGAIKGYTSARLPVSLAWAAQVETADLAFRLERQIKGWSRAKKEALIRGDFLGIHDIVTRERKRRSGRT